MKSFRDFATLALATCGFLTYPLARISQKKGSHMTGAGFIGTLAGLATVRFLPLEPRRGLFVLLGAFFISVVISDLAEAILGHKDDQRIVIDEWVGYWFALAFLPQTPKFLLIGFVLFRLLDTWKPLGIKQTAKLPGGWGIVMDDVAAGILVNLCLRVLAIV